jgi:hypothetical protein
MTSRPIAISADEHRRERSPASIAFRTAASTISSVILTLFSRSAGKGRHARLAAAVAKHLAQLVNALAHAFRHRDQDGRT